MYNNICIDTLKMLQRQSEKVCAAIRAFGHITTTKDGKRVFIDEFIENENGRAKTYDKGHKGYNYMRLLTVISDYIDKMVGRLEKGLNVNKMGGPSAHKKLELKNLLSLVTNSIRLLQSGLGNNANNPCLFVSNGNFKRLNEDTTVRAGLLLEGMAVVATPASNASNSAAVLAPAVVSGTAVRVRLQPMVPLWQELGSQEKKSVISMLNVNIVACRNEKGRLKKAEEAYNAHHKRHHDEMLIKSKKKRGKKYH